MSSFAMTHSSVFKAGIAIAPVVDWRLYDSIYTERYMGTPQENPEGYDKSTVLGLANKMNGPFLLVHGTMDDNVHYQNAVKLAWDLQTASVDFDLMIYTRSRHGINTKVHSHLFRKMTNFLERNLLLVDHQTLE